MGSRLRALLGVVLLLALCGVVPTAAAEPREVTVATHDIAPFVITQNHLKSGFTVDLLDEIAKREQWNITYLDVFDVAKQLQAVTDKQADLAAGAISITADRSRTFDFSQPILNAGLQIAVPAHAMEASRPGLANFLRLLFSTSMIVWLLAALIITVVPAHLAWLIERRHPDSMVAKSYFPGIFQSFGWGLAALTGGAPDTPRHSMSRAFATLWAFVGIIFVAYYTATLTASLTVQKFEAKITGPGDLIGRQVVTVAGTTSAQYLRDMGVQARGMANIRDAFAALRNEGYDAIVFDAPVLQYWVAHDGNGVAQLAGPVFQSEDYGMAFRNGSELRRQVDQALLSMREDGSYDLIKHKWFGNEQLTDSTPG